MTPYYVQLISFLDFDFFTQTVGLKQEITAQKTNEDLLGTYTISISAKVELEDLYNSMLGKYIIELELEITLTHINTERK